MKGGAYERSQRYGYRFKYIGRFGHADVNSLLVTSNISVKSTKYEESIGLLEIWREKNQTI